MTAGADLVARSLAALDTCSVSSTRRARNQRSEALLHRQGCMVLDPVYTAKAFGGLIGRDRSRPGKARRPGVFVHTGGTPALFADPALYWHAD